MPVTGNAFFEQKISQFEMRSSHSTFGNDYIRAVNFTLAQMYAELDLASEPDQISDTNDNIDLDNDYEFVLSMGVDYYLVRFGHRSGHLNLSSAFASFDGALKTARLRRDFATRDAATDGEQIAMLDD